MRPMPVEVFRPLDLLRLVEILRERLTDLAGLVRSPAVQFLFASIFIAEHADGMNCCSVYLDDWLADAFDWYDLERCIQRFLKGELHHEEFAAAEVRTSVPSTK